MAIPIKTRDDILTSIRNAVEGLNTNLNVGDHSVAYDISLYPGSVLGADLWLLSDFVIRTRSLSGLLSMLSDMTYKESLSDLLQYDTITDVEILLSSLIDALVGNWNVTRKPAVAARVPVRFYSATNSAITVPAGRRVSTRGASPKEFTVMGGVTNGVSHYDSSRGLYYIEVMCAATEPGSAGNIRTGAITALVDTISGVIQCTNPVTAYGGSDQEDDTALVARAQLAWRAWSLDTRDGMENFFLGQPNVDDAYIAPPEDPLNTRNPQGTPIDVFVATPADSVGNVDVFVMAASQTIPMCEYNPLANMMVERAITVNAIYAIEFPPEHTGNTLYYYFNKQPVVSVQSVSGSTAGAMEYIFHPDVNSPTSGSVRSKSCVEITVDPAVATLDETIEIQYTYDSAVLALQNTVDAPSNNLLSQDTLVRAAMPIYVNITGSVITLSSLVHTDVLDVIEADLQKFFGGGRTSFGNIYSKFGLGQRLDRSDTLVIALNVIGVDRIDSWIVEINGLVFNSFYEPRNSEYIRLGTVVWL